MKAMIFAAGLGTRLRPLTDHLPKALVSIKGRTLLDMTIDRLVSAGATEIVVNVHHFADLIERHLAAHTYPVPIRTSDERAELLDTGGGLRHAAPLFTADGAPILIHNVDILHNADLRSFYAAAPEADVLLLVSRRETSRYLLFDDDLRLVGWTNVKTGEVRSPYSDLDVARCQRFAFSGIHRFSPRLFPLMADEPAVFPIVDFYLRHCATTRIVAHPVEGLELLDVGKTAVLETLNSK